MQIFKNIREARVAAGKTQQEMADLVGVKRTTYASWESKVIPDVMSLIRLGEIFSINWTSLVKETVVGEPIKPGNTDIADIKEIAKTTKENTEALLKAASEILQKMNKQKKANP